MKTECKDVVIQNAEDCKAANDPTEEKKLKEQALGKILSILIIQKQ